MPALQRIGVATDLVAYAARCIPIATRVHDIYAIWFFALDVIQVCVEGRKVGEMIWKGGEKKWERLQIQKPNDSHKNLGPTVDKIQEV